MADLGSGEPDPRGLAFADPEQTNGTASPQQPQVDASQTPIEHPVDLSDQEPFQTSIDSNGGTISDSGVGSAVDKEPDQTADATAAQDPAAQQAQPPPPSFTSIVLSRHNADITFGEALWEKLDGIRDKGAHGVKRPRTLSSLHSTAGAVRPLIHIACSSSADQHLPRRFHTAGAVCLLYSAHANRAQAHRLAAHTLLALLQPSPPGERARHGPTPHSHLRCTRAAQVCRAVAAFLHERADVEEAFGKALLKAVKNASAALGGWAPRLCGGDGWGGVLAALRSIGKQHVGLGICVRQNLSRVLEVFTATQAQEVQRLGDQASCVVKEMEVSAAALSAATWGGRGGGAAVSVGQSGGSLRHWRLLRCGAYCVFTHASSLCDNRSFVLAHCVTKRAHSIAAAARAALRNPQRRAATDARLGTAHWQECTPLHCDNRALWASARCAIILSPLLHVPAPAHVVHSNAQYNMPPPPRSAGAAGALLQDQERIREGVHRRHACGGGAQQGAGGGGGGGRGCESGGGGGAHAAQRRRQGRVADAQQDAVQGGRGGDEDGHGQGAGVTLRYCAYAC
ncbi:hypothetical protein JKP88DRAFT_339217 [Tribonema minus]|uniref:Uncharacterized protein n=1 Tax=Tribonema minus TaxID=303371 RepID=A0A835YIW1_9STRA|nr:hypothetical protein JKP88DRAFT_339217 [Tribonema minus]